MSEIDVVLLAHLKVWQGRSETVIDRISPNPCSLLQRRVMVVTWARNFPAGN